MYISIYLYLPYYSIIAFIIIIIVIIIIVKYGWQDSLANKKHDFATLHVSQVNMYSKSSQGAYDFAVKKARLPDDRLTTGRSQPARQPARLSVHPPWLACQPATFHSPRWLKHSCHILPFQPILWNRYFPSEPAKTYKSNPQPISEGGRIWQVCWVIMLVDSVCGLRALGTYKGHDNINNNT